MTDLMSLTAGTHRQTSCYCCCCHIPPDTPHSSSAASDSHSIFPFIYCYCQRMFPFWTK